MIQVMNNLTETILLVGGVFNLGFAIFHLMFWRLFNWKRDLAALTLINRAVMQVLNLCLTFVFLVMAYVSIAHASDLVSTDLGRTLLIAFSLFWFLRMIEQIIFFGVKRRASLAFAIAFLAGSVIYLLPMLVKS